MEIFTWYIGDYRLTYKANEPHGQDWFLQNKDGEGMSLSSINFRDLLHDHFKETF